MADSTGRRKRPPKKDCINFLKSQFALLETGIVGYTKEIAAEAIKQGGYFLYKGEVEKLLDEGDFTNEQMKAYVAMLKSADALQVGAAPKFGEGITRINSMDRALQVVNDPANAEEVVVIMTDMLVLRDKLNPLISVKASCSIALKNKKDKKTEGEEEKVAESPSEENTEA